MAREPYNQPRQRVTVVDLETVLDAVQEDDNSGFCLACGEQTWGVEPDARKYRCEGCGKLEVYGAEEVLLMMA